MIIKVHAEYKKIQPIKSGFYSFVNPASIGSVLDNRKYIELTYFSDGWLLSFVFSVLLWEKVRRASFDFTSIANIVFEDADKEKSSVYIVGASESEVQIFVAKLRKKYSNMKIAGFANGYDYDEESVFRFVKDNAVDVVVAGLGSGKQESFLIRLKESGYAGAAFSCGGFIRQEAGSQNDYYPHFIDKLNLRAFYRMYKEPHTVKRYAFDYPKNLLKLICLMIFGKIKIKILK